MRNIWMFKRSLNCAKRCRRHILWSHVNHRCGMLDRLLDQLIKVQSHHCVARGEDVLRPQITVRVGLIVEGRQHGYDGLSTKLWL